MATRTAAKRQPGELLREMEKHPGNRGAGHGKVRPSSSNDGLTLKSLGISHDESSLWQRLAPKLERIVAEFEDRWRAAALKGQPQFRGTACGGVGESGRGHCAWTIGGAVIGTVGVRVDWRCACGWRALLLPQVMIHLNNAHHFDWLDLANKFRPTLEAGLIPSTRRRKAVA